MSGRAGDILIPVPAVVRPTATGQHGPTHTAAGAGSDIARRLSEHGARVAAGILKISVAEYRAHEAADEHHCAGCHRWKHRSQFPSSAIRPRGVGAYCMPCQSDLDAETYRRRLIRQARTNGRRQGVAYAGPSFEARREGTAS